MASFLGRVRVWDRVRVRVLFGVLVRFRVTQLGFGLGFGPEIKEQGLQK